MKKFSKEEIELFLGSSVTMSEVINFIMDIANKEYEVDVLISDIEETIAQVEEVVEDNTALYNREDVKALDELVKRAEENSEEVFEYRGDKYHPPYAKYLVAYLKRVLDK